MDAIRISEGEKINYSPAATVATGQIVEFGNIVGVAERAIAASAQGALTTSGVFRLTKDGSTGPVFAVGDAVFFDLVNELAVRTGGSGCVYFGPCVAAAGTNQAWVDTELDPESLPGYQGDMLWEDVDLTSADTTLDIEDCGKVMNVLTGSGTYTVILPEAAAGLEYIIRCGTAGELITVATDQTPTADKVAGPDITGTAGKGRVLAAATSKKGDYVYLAYGAAETWIIRAQRGVWAEES